MNWGGDDNKVLSISYQGTSYFEKAAYPVNIYHTQNTTLSEVDTLPLKDIFIIDDHFVEAFKSGIYSNSRDDLDNDANYKLTKYGVILSIEVPHAIGDHLEMAIPYEAMEANMIKNSLVWKDYLFTKGAK